MALDGMGWKEADPTKSSVFPESVRNLHPVDANSYGRDIVQDDTGRMYHHIINSPEDQLFVSRLLKGIMPISDIVYEKSTGKFYSYDVPEEHIEKDPKSKAGMLA